MSGGIIEYGEAIVKDTINTIGKKLLSRLYDAYEDIRKDNISNDIIASLTYPDINNMELAQQVNLNVNNRYLYFRSLLSANKRIHVDEIFHPLSVKCFDDEITKDISKDELFDENLFVVLIGKAGQGKTTSLRKIISNEINKEGGKIPILILLRNLEWKNKQNICDIVSSEFNSIGVPVASDLVPYFITKNKILICFDGFDEVPHEFRRKALNLIKSVKHSFNGTALITTRPDTEVTYETGEFINLEIENLKKDDVEAMIANNPCIEESERELLLDNLKGSNIYDVLVTPILTDIYMASFYYLKETPKTEIDFYNDLFMALSDRHDRIKSLDRATKTGLDKRELYNIFVKASLHILVSGDQISFLKTDFEGIFSKYAKGYDLDPRGRFDSFSDVMDITSLIVPDGLFFSYVHKSILEFHAAKLLATDVNEEMKARVLGKISLDGNPRFDNFLKFFYELDFVAFNELYFFKVIDNFCSDCENLDMIEVISNEMKIPKSINKKDGRSIEDYPLLVVSSGKLLGVLSLILGGDFSEYYEKTRRTISDVVLLASKNMRDDKEGRYVKLRGYLQEEGLTEVVEEFVGYVISISMDLKEKAMIEIEKRREISSMKDLEDFL
ncbi:MAG: hypothetical protein COA78_27565 [Blastopirellula sp.]|nr:MAG: hypothetical protein COA78_27565 [Blastopirellula sp.]